MKYAGKKVNFSDRQLACSLWGVLHELPPGAPSVREESLLPALQQGPSIGSSRVLPGGHLAQHYTHSLPRGYHLERKQPCDPLSYTGDIQSLKKTHFSIHSLKNNCYIASPPPPQAGPWLPPPVSQGSYLVVLVFEHYRR